MIEKSIRLDVVNILKDRYHCGGRIYFNDLIRELNDYRADPIDITAVDGILKSLNKKGIIKIIEYSKLNGYPIVFDYK